MTCYQFTLSSNCPSGHLALIIPGVALDQEQLRKHSVCHQKAVSIYLFQVLVIGFARVVYGPCLYIFLLDFNKAGKPLMR